MKTLTLDSRTTLAPTDAPAGRHGMDILQDPSVTKSTAFGMAEREALGLTGLLPEVVESEDMQLRRVLQQLGHKSTDIDRYVYLIGLLDPNATLFYRPLIPHPPPSLPTLHHPPPP